MEDQNQQLWQAVLGELELNLSKAAFTTWLKNTFIIENDDGHIVIGVPNTFSREWLKQKYHQNIYKILQDRMKERIRQIDYKVQTLKTYQQQVEQLKKTIIEEKKTEKPLEEAPVSRFGLNSKYIFDTFVVGKANELAHAASLAVADRPGLTYNPLFIYGGVGLGKTHLLQAIGHSILNRKPTAQILYATCEQFTNDFISSVASRQMEKFVSRYRSPELLLIDDIQFLTGKEGTQEAFFHTFNDLHQKNKQIVITSDRPPKAIATLEDRLLTRFEWGMIADIGQPDLETRIAILETKCKEKNFDLGRDVIQYITLNIQNNVRELEGALNKIIAYYQLNKMEPSMENIKKILFSISDSSKKSRALNPKQLMEVICSFYDISMNELLGQSREKRLSFPRQIIMYILREDMGCSFPMIGAELGGRDHTTAMHAHGKITGLVASDEKLRQEINLIKQKLYA